MNWPAATFALAAVTCTVLIGTVVYKGGQIVGEFRTMLRAHCRDIGMLMKRMGIDPPPAPGRDDPTLAKSQRFT